MSNWKKKKKIRKYIFIIILLRLLGEHSHANNVINALQCYAFCSCFYVQVFVINYFGDFPEIFWIEGRVGGVYRIQTFLDFYIFFILTRPLNRHLTDLTRYRPKQLLRWVLTRKPLAYRESTV